LPRWQAVSATSHGQNQPCSAGVSCFCRPPLERKLAELQREAEAIAELAGPFRKFSLGNNGDCQDLLYVHLALPPPPSAKKLKNGDRSTAVKLPDTCLYMKQFHIKRFGGAF